ncbi:hypothetical protein Tco_1488266, partial [Tanacetum coccineum]
EISAFRIGGDSNTQIRRRLVLSELAVIVIHEFAEEPLVSELVEIFRVRIRRRLVLSELAVIVIHEFAGEPLVSELAEIFRVRIRNHPSQSEFATILSIRICNNI